MLIQTIVWIAGLAVATAVTILLNDPVHYAMARAFGWIVPRESRKVTGLWIATYSYVGETEKVVVTEVIELKQFGKYVVGRNIKGPWQKNTLEGKFQMETYLTALWENVQTQDRYHGAFQCVLSPQGDTMSGRWIGFDKQQIVKGGPWEWKRVSVSMSSKAREKAIKSYKSQQGSDPG